MVENRILLNFCPQLQIVGRSKQILGWIILLTCGKVKMNNRLDSVINIFKVAILAWLINYWKEDHSLSCFLHDHVEQTLSLLFIGSFFKGKFPEYEP